MKNLIIFLALLFPFRLAAQNNLLSIDLEKIPQETIRVYLEHRQQIPNPEFKSLKASIHSGDPYKELKRHKKSYRIKVNAESSWETYLQANPDKTWDGKRVSFGLLISKLTNDISYKNEGFSGFHVGQICFIQIKLLRGHEKLAVAFEVIEINPVEKEIKFSYLEGGKSMGIQTIRITNTKRGFAKIDHITYYQSDSKFRDRFLYPYFHSKVLREYHGNMKKIALNKMNSAEAETL